MPKRSPTYPSYDLQRAVSFIEKIHDSAGNSKIDRETALKLMGFAALSGPASAAFSSLRQYGLISGREADVQLTPLALQILHPVSSEERREALREAALTPEIFRAVLAHFSGKFPADEVLKAHLIRVREFNPNGAAAFVTALRRTVEFLSSNDISLSHPSGMARDESVTELDRRTDQARQTSREPSVPRESAEEGRYSRSTLYPAAESGLPQIESLSFRLSPKVRVSLKFEGPVTQSGISTLIDFLRLSQNTYPEDADIDDGQDPDGC